MGKVIFLDIDGTIRNFDGTIPATAAEAVRKARQNGHEVLINTGREYFRIEKEVLDIGFDGVIASSGGYVEYKGEKIARRYFTQLAYIELMKDLLEQRCVVEMGNSKESYVLRDSREEYQRILDEVFQGKSMCREPLVPVWVESLLDVPEVEKLVVFGRDDTSRTVLSKWGYSFHITDLRISVPGIWAGEITPNYSTKAEGMRQILKAKECGREDTVAVGDSDNDIEMIRYAGTGVAMGNGTEWVKEIADFVTAPIMEDGLWKAFVHMGLV